MQIPMSSPDVTDAERDAVMAVLRTPNLSMGPRIDAFEKAVSAYTGSKHAIAVNSGTAGLHLCALAAGVQAGDLVITTPFSFVASSNVLLYERAVPVFVDVDPVTGNMNIQQAVETAAALNGSAADQKRRLPRRGAELGGRLKGILAVDVFGQPADMDPLRELADHYDLALIEDSCEALGSAYKGRQAGTLGDMGVFAFYPNKQITTGEGGLIITDDDRAAQTMRALRNQGRAPGDTWLSHTYLGYNYRLDEMSAALGEVQMSRIDELITSRERVAGWYSERLAEIAAVELPVIVPDTTRMSWFVYVIRVRQGVNREQVAERLTQKGIPVRPYFLPIHLQPYMVDRFGYQPGDFPVTEDLGARGLALPFSGKMTEEQVDQVCRLLQAAV
ncbi:MAG: DegT/DnrJ/EryC1/StrS family aminotransferase [Anaerolineae bacterium]|nr:DegT/DnrJ/EryC1/StrS family aminotransferase [Anaerolineae bacterium]